MEFKCLLCGNDKSLFFNLEMYGEKTANGDFEIRRPIDEMILDIVDGSYSGGWKCGVCRNYVFVMEEEQNMSDLTCRECGGEEMLTRVKIPIEGIITGNGVAEIPGLTDNMILAGINEKLDDGGSIDLECKACAKLREYKMVKAKGGNHGNVLSAV